jgi:GDP-4-dehydro-6-deoxy-D-mannose reductase
LIKVGDLSAERDFGDIDDLVRALAEVLGAEGQLPPRSVFNICSGVTRPVSAVLDRLLALARVPITVEVDPARLRPNSIPRAAGSHEALTAATGWRPREPFDLTIERVLEGWRRTFADPRGEDAGL